MIIGLRVAHSSGTGIGTAGVVLVTVADDDAGAIVGLWLASDVVLGVRSDDVASAAAVDVVGIGAGAESVEPELSSMVLVASVSVLLAMVVSGDEDDDVVVGCAV